MAPTVSSDFNANEPRTFNNDKIPIRVKECLKKRLEDLIGFTEDGDLNSSRGERESQATTGAKEKRLDDDNLFAQFEAFRASDDHRSRKEENPKKAPSVQMNGGFVQEQLLFECGTCRKNFENVADLHEHISKHKEQPPVRCRKCRKTFTDVAELNHHFQTSPRHFCCRYCNPVVEFRNADSLWYHYKDRHHKLYCHFCDRHFPNTFQRLSHMKERHRSCSACRKMFLARELYNDHCRTCYSAKFGEAFPEAPNGDGSGERVPNHYARLGISAHSSHEQVLKAAKEMRVKMHPDRLKRQEGLTEEQKRAIDVEAAIVGEAADVLSDPVLRQKYDCKIRGW